MVNSGLRMRRHHVPFLLWPFWLVWRLSFGILNVTGRILGVVLGIGMTIAGLALSATIIGAVLGIPMIILGVILTFSSIF